MARTPDLDRKQDLLDDVTNYVRRFGVSDLSLRPLAKGVSTSPRNLLYHFGSSAEMITAIIDRSLEFDRTGLEKALEETQPTTAAEVLATIWGYLVRNHNAIRLYVDLSSVGQTSLNELEDRIEQLTKPWRDALLRTLLNSGAPEVEARDLTELSISGLWGSMISLGSAIDAMDLAMPAAISRLMRILDDAS